MGVVLNREIQKFQTLVRRYKIYN